MRKMRVIIPHLNCDEIANKADDPQDETANKYKFYIEE